eukprot:CAMPEP_0198545552 /NCGR_PEP_ID=MMETSP1462-20131121/64470_1 /TAXON_ID=1333877 /ORGANISM="Brandtodinium nutriculum, Strain RCC3387" /LENGTH=41 /DNA_ID= /DNA_START= /DNA_END= /DNA_ORIENTATION=
MKLYPAHLVTVCAVTPPNFLNSVQAWKCGCSLCNVTAASSL